MITILVTDGAGFIGSNFIKMMLKEHPDYKVVNLDALTYARNLENLSDIAGVSNYVFEKGDIRDSTTVDRIFRQHNITHVVNFAAESHVEDTGGHRGTAGCVITIPKSLPTPLIFTIC